MSICIVVSRYNENVEWTKSFYNVIIYNKGTELNKPDSNHIYNEVFLNNVGREGHTYYKHICDNYNNLADFTIFLQGDPFPHSRDAIQKIQSYVDNKQLNVDFEFLNATLDCNLSGCRHHSGLPLIDVYEKLFGEKKLSMEFDFGPGAQFIVSKKNILNRSKDFYSKIVDILGYDINPIEGFVIERFHKLIFKPDNIEILLNPQILKNFNTSNEGLNAVKFNFLSHFSSHFNNINISIISDLYDEHIIKLYISALSRNQTNKVTHYTIMDSFLRDNDNARTKIAFICHNNIGDIINKLTSDNFSGILLFENISIKEWNNIKTPKFDLSTYLQDTNIRMTLINENKVNLAFKTVDVENK